MLFSETNNAFMVSPPDAYVCFYLVQGLERRPHGPGIELQRAMDDGQHRSQVLQPPVKLEKMGLYVTWNDGQTRHVYWVGLSRNVNPSVQRWNVWGAGHKGYHPVFTDGGEGQGPRFRTFLNTFLYSYTLSSGCLANQDQLIKSC
jgi:hypothetical protein